MVVPAECSFKTTTTNAKIVQEASDDKNDNIDDDDMLIIKRNEYAPVCVQRAHQAQWY